MMRQITRMTVVALLVALPIAIVVQLALGRYVTGLPFAICAATLWIFRKWTEAK